MRNNQIAPIQLRATNTGRCLCYLSLLFMLFNTKVYAQHGKLRAEILQLSKLTRGKVGVALNLLENNDTLTFHNQAHYVLHSVAKFAVGLDMLHEIDRGRFKLDQLVYLTKKDLPKSYSPLRDKYPRGNVNVPIKTLLAYMISLSDNDACDILYKKIGGTAHVEEFLHRAGIKNIAIRATEGDMAAGWPAQYTDWTEPYEQARLLKMMYDQSLLSKKSNDFLWKIMLATTTAPNRLKGMLPAGTAVAHKSGTSGTNEKGLSPATNDEGIILLPNGKHLAIAVFITDATEDEATRDGIIAKISAAVYQEFSNE